MRAPDDVKTEGHIPSGLARGVLRAWRNAGSCDEGVVTTPGAVDADELF
jgi:hypothetical protein